MSLRTNFSAILLAQYTKTLHILLHKNQRDRSPMLLVSIVGYHYMQVFGTAWNGSVICTDPLSSPVSLLYVPRDPNKGVSKVPNVLAAIDRAASKFGEVLSATRKGESN